MQVIDNKLKSMKGRAISLPLFFVLAFVLIGIVYAPGLANVYVLDDGYNLKIDNNGEKIICGDFDRFLFSDDSGPGLRVIGRASFLADCAMNFGAAESRVFSLLLHLVNVILLFFLIKSLLRCSYAGASWAAYVAVIGWALIPVHTSTVFYVVQRYTIISTLFCILGMLLYAYGRKLSARSVRKSYLIISMAIIAFTPLAALSKETGVLLPLFVLLLEFFFFRRMVAKNSTNCALSSCNCNRNQPSLIRLNKIWSFFFILLPALAIFVVMIYYSSVIGFSGRDFSLSERLLTQPRVLTEYLWLSLSPMHLPRGVLVDGYQVSRSMISPMTTLPAILFFLLLLYVGWKYRSSKSLISFTILFYVVGHVLESSILPLELYFEHRNYAPSMFLFLPLGLLVAEGTESRRYVALLFACFVGLMAFSVFRMATVWSSADKLATFSLQRNPNSTRAIGYYSTILVQKGRPDVALNVLRKALLNQPSVSHLALHALSIKCGYKGLGVNEARFFMQQFVRYPLKKSSLPLLRDLTERASNGKCQNMLPSDIVDILQFMIENGGQHYQEWEFYQILGEALCRSGHVHEALHLFRDVVQLHPDIGLGLLQVALIAASGNYSMALQWLETVEKLPQPHGWRNKLRLPDYNIDIDRMRSLLHEDRRRLMLLEGQAL